MSWIPFDKIVEKIKTRKFNWLLESRTKYLVIRIDTRDDYATLSDRDGKLIASTEEELDKFFDKLNKKAENNMFSIKLMRDFEKLVGENRK